MTRQEAVDRLCDVYAGSYDVTRCEENEHALAATMDFYATAEKYVLSKKAKLWQANNPCHPPWYGQESDGSYPRPTSWPASRRRRYNLRPGQRSQ